MNSRQSSSLSPVAPSAPAGNEYPGSSQQVQPADTDVVSLTEQTLTSTFGKKSQCFAIQELTDGRVRLEGHISSATNKSAEEELNQAATSTIAPGFTATGDFEPQMSASARTRPFNEAEKALARASVAPDSGLGMALRLCPHTEPRNATARTYELTLTAEEATEVYYAVAARLGEMQQGQFHMVTCVSNPHMECETEFMGQ